MQITISRPRAKDTKSNFVAMLVNLGRGLKMRYSKNGHREDDRTTRWFRENVRQPLSDDVFEFEPGRRSIGSLEDVITGTLIFRWFNRIETGEIILDLLLGRWDTAEARKRLTGISPVVTGAYIIKAGDGVSKLEGILACIDNAIPHLQGMAQKWDKARLAGTLRLEAAWADLKELDYMGPFMAYEVVTDLRHTPVLNEAKDIMTWGNLGPGAIRGIGWVVANNPEQFANTSKQQKEMLNLMHELLLLSKTKEFWPQEWPGWEMHEVEMWLCEYAKYRNAMEGERLKRRYRV
jgi:hypothetical protein